MNRIISSSDGYVQVALGNDGKKLQYPVDTSITVNDLLSSSVEISPMSEGRFSLAVTIPESAAPLLVTYHTADGRVDTPSCSTSAQNLEELVGLIRSSANGRL